MERRIFAFFATLLLALCLSLEPASAAPPRIGYAYGSFYAGGPRFGIGFNIGNYPYPGPTIFHPAYGYYSGYRSYYGPYYPRAYGYSSYYLPRYVFGYYYNYYGGYQPDYYQPARPALRLYSGDPPLYYSYGEPAAKADEVPPNAVLITVRVPDDAKIWFSGQPTQQSGSIRKFVSPPLEPGKTYSYEVKASWNENGKTVEKTKTIPVRAGEHLTVEFP
ncbi:MAG: hypothetical protein KatS3mg105_1590 [Gemmatales bacterium]|nr:MAG: hypothetical protein KatS3mg105_1590 [Gemmatales bacterium]